MNHRDSLWMTTGADGQGTCHIRAVMSNGNYSECLAHTRSIEIATEIVDAHNQGLMFPNDLYLETAELAAWAEAHRT